MQNTHELINKCNAFYNELIISTKTLALLEEQKAIGNILWIKNVQKNFIPIIEMIKEVEQYR